MSSLKEVAKRIRDVLKDIYNTNIFYFMGKGINQGKVLCVYGDSITYQARWYKPVIYIQSLKHIVNKGVPGATITGVNGLSAEKNLSRLLDFKSDAVMIMGGVNDFKCSREIGTIDSMNIDEFYGAYKHMLDKIQEMFPDKKVILATPTYCKCNKDFPKTDGKMNDAGFTIKDYAEAVTKIGQLYHLKVIPLFDELKWDANNCVKYITDEGEFLHPNKFGGRCMGKIIGEELPRF